MASARGHAASRPHTPTGAAARRATGPSESARGPGGRKGLRWKWRSACRVVCSSRLQPNSQHLANFPPPPRKHPRTMPSLSPAPSALLTTSPATSTQHHHSRRDSPLDINHHDLHHHNHHSAAAVPCGGGGRAWRAQPRLWPRAQRRLLLPGEGDCAGGRWQEAAHCLLPGRCSGCWPTFIFPHSQHPPPPPPAAQVDDFGWANMGAHRDTSDPEVQTPNMDQLIKGEAAEAVLCVRGWN